MSRSRQWLVDFGNTRLKCAVLRGERLGRSVAFEHRGSSARIARFLNTLGAAPDAVFCVSVAGERLERALVAGVSRAFDVAVTFVRSTTIMPPMRVGYDEPWRLGADRWVAAVAGFAAVRGRRDVVVVDAGTALTVDVVRRDGQHLGGVIVPGPVLMVTALLERTRGIRVRARGVVRSIVGRPRANRGGHLGQDTRAALDLGAALAVAGLIDRIVADTRRSLKRKPVLLLTGGAAPAIAPFVQTQSRQIPDLVLQGLAQFAHRAAASR